MGSFIDQHTGEMASLFVAFCWTLTSLAFESAGRKVGSLQVNIIRLLMAFVLLGFLSWIRNDMFLPLNASIDTWFWLGISGFVGFVLGDVFLFQAFVVVGARISMLIMSLAPPLAALFGWWLLGERLTLSHFIGMGITLAGISLVVISKTRHSGLFQINYPIKGVLFALGGALGQGLGLVISKLGMKDYDPFLSTQIRVIFGIFGFGVIMAFTGHLKSLLSVVKHKPAMIRISIGAFFGPFLGVSYSLLAIQHTTTGVASTIMSIVPVLIILPSYFVMKEKITLKEIIGAVIAVVGVSVLFL